MNRAGIPDIGLGRSFLTIYHSSKIPRASNALPPRVNSALSEEAVLLNMVTNDHDGTVTYHFGAEQETHTSIAPKVKKPEVSIVAPIAEHQVTVLPTSPSEVIATTSTASVSQNTSAASASAATPMKTETKQAAKKLEELLHLDTQGIPATRSYQNPKSSSIAKQRQHTANNNLQSSTSNRTNGQRSSVSVNGRRLKDTPPRLDLNVDLESLDYTKEDSYTLVSLYSRLCDAEKLDDALVLLNHCIKANRNDALIKVRHHKFLRCASRLRGVSKALRFVQLLPRQFADARTYNMLLSVCAAAGDLRNALHTVDMLKAAGLRMDTIMYTNLIKVCAAAGDADTAFRFYDEMKTNNVRMEKEVFATLVSACSRHIESFHATDRRPQLVLLERAFGLLDDMKAVHLQADAPVWNALVTAAGRAGQLQRAFDVLDNMMATSSKPNSRTYASLIDACARTGDKALALRVYRRALKDGAGNDLPVYSAAINACIRAREGADLPGAMSIYNDLQRQGVIPDSALFGALIMAAGKGGNLELTVTLEEEMRSDGIPPCEGTDSALITVHILNDRLTEATRLYNRLRSEGRLPHSHAMNALINANARAFRLGDVVNLVCDMVDSGMAIDEFTFAAVLNACQRANESELALDVYRLMKMRGMRLEEVHAMLLLRMCYNRIRPPPTDALPLSSNLSASHRSQERAKLLKALTPKSKKRQGVKEPVGDVVWHAQAFAIYRDAVSNGAKPSLRVLNMALMCLKLPWNSQKNLDLEEFALPPVAGIARQAANQGKVGIESVYHVQVLSILEDAIVSGVLPAFQVDSPEPIDLRNMPPAIAEVYTLTVISALQRKVDSRRELINRCVFRVPRYDGAKVLMPSALRTDGTAAKTELVNGRAHVAPPASSDLPPEFEIVSFNDADNEYEAASRDAVGEEKTGLGVAGVLRRLQLWAREHSPEGLIVLEAKEVTRWAKATTREIEKRSVTGGPLGGYSSSSSSNGSSSGNGVTPGFNYFGQQNNLQQQQRGLRMGF